MDTSKEVREMKNLIKAEKELWKVNETEKNSLFLKSLSNWVIKYFGNVNVAQRLNILAIDYKTTEE